MASLCVVGLLALTATVSAQQLTSHAERERPMPDPATANQWPNPHSDLIFRATGARSCRDCHDIDKTGALSPRPLENTLVTMLRDKAKGVHGPGRFADCLRCHAGGRKGVEKY
jgi:hypothetical protein